MKPIDRDPAPSREEALYLARRNGHGGELEGQAPGDWAMRLALGASRVLRTHWRVVAAAGFSAMFVTYCLTKFCMTRIYRAQTLVRPASQEPQSSVSLGALSTMTTSMVPLQMLFGQSAASDEQEFEAILGSVAFADELVKKHNLFDVFYNQKRGFVGRIIRSTFRFIFGARQGQGSSRFDNYYAVSNGLWWEFDKSTGNMNIYFADPNPRAAVRVLTLIIRDLREQIRNRVRLADRKSIDALQAEILGARDPQLVANLEQLLAQQMQDLGTAEARSDFAFVVEDPPDVPPRPYSPRPVLDSIVAFILACTVAFVWIAKRESKLAVPSRAPSDREDDPENRDSSIHVNGVKQDEAF